MIKKIAMCSKQGQEKMGVFSFTAERDHDLYSIKNGKGLAFLQKTLMIMSFIGGIFLFNVFNAYAGAIYYVRAGANGAKNGSDWTNAYASLPNNLVRGAAYYVGDGIYSGYTFDDAQSASTYIIIKKAIESDHGTNTGWKSSYGDGQAVFTGQLTFLTSYWMFDGQKGGGPGSWENGFGFKIKKSGGSASKCIRFDKDPIYITIQHVDIENSGEDAGGKADSIYSLGCNFVTIRNCWIHNTNRTNFLLNSTQNFTIEYSLISERHNIDSSHGEHISANYCGSNSNHVYRYNIFRNAGGANTGVIVIKDSVQSGWEIYGNIFYNTDTKRYTSSNGVITDTTGDSTTNVKIYNNTFLPHYNGYSSPVAAVSWDVSTGNEFRNNIVMYNGGLSGVAISSHNLWISESRANDDFNGQYFSGTETDLFIDPANGNFSLKLPTESGYVLPAPFDTDLKSNPRGMDGSWDRGAYEYTDNSQPLSTPINLRITNQ